MQPNMTPYRPGPLAAPGDAPESYDAHGQTGVKDTLHQVLRILYHGKWLIVLVFAAVMIPVTVYLRTAPPEYSTSSLLLSDQNRQQSAYPRPTAQDEALTFGFVDGESVGAPDLESQVVLLETSMAVAERVAERLIAADSASAASFSALRPYYTADSTDHYSPELSAALNIQKNHIDIETGDRDEETISITGYGSSPEEATFIANTYAEEAVSYARDIGRQRITASREFLQEQLSEQHARLTTLESELEQYMSTQGAVALEEESSNIVSQMAALESSRDEVSIERDMKAAQLSSLEEELERIHPNLATRVASELDGEIERAQTRIAELEAKLQPYSSRNPDLVAEAEDGQTVSAWEREITYLRGRVDSLSAQYVEEMMATGGIEQISHQLDPTDPKTALAYAADLQRRVADERIALNGLEAKEAALNQRLEGYASRLEALPTQSIRLAQLQRGRESAEQLYVSLQEKLQEALIAERAEVGSLQIIRPALLPLSPHSPNTTRTYALGFMLACLLGFGAAFLRAQLDSRLFGPGDVEAKGHKLLGVIPDAASVLPKAQRKALAARAPNGSTAGPLMLHAPESSAAESYRNLYVQFQFNASRSALRRILVTSAEAGAGKSTTALNLAITAAQSGHRTLLIDADLRRPTIHHYLHLAGVPSMSDLAEAERSGFDVEHLASEVDNLYVLPVHEPVARSKEQLGTRNFRQFIDELTSQFDFVVFDTPPLLLASDALLFAHSCDAAVLVAAAGQTHAESLAKAQQRLADAGAPLLGTILNRASHRHMYGANHTYGYAFEAYDEYYGHA